MRQLTRLEGFCNDVLAACDRGLPVTAEDVVEGLKLAHKLRYDAEDRLRFDQGLEHVLMRARKRQEAIEQASAIIFGLTPK